MALGLSGDLTGGQSLLRTGWTVWGLTRQGDFKGLILAFPLLVLLCSFPLPNSCSIIRLQRLILKDCTTTVPWAEFVVKI
uniref:Uncharacterized protein n=1 Tax=Mus musculus TaxID=10090 RepID=Q3TZ24_MOUSE|nr:unnamed protein product [Mus musculus]